MPGADSRLEDRRAYSCPEGPYLTAPPAQRAYETRAVGAGSAYIGVVNTEGLVRQVGTEVKPPRVGVALRRGQAFNGVMETGVPPESPRKHKGKKRRKKNGEKSKRSGKPKCH